MTKPNLSDPKVKKDIEQNKIIAAIGYIGVLCLIPLLLKQDSQYAQFHGKQGLLLFIGWVVNTFIAVVPIIGWIVSFFGAISLLILTVLGILKSLKGEYWEMPYIGEYTKKINI